MIASKAPAESNVLPILGFVLLVLPVYFIARWIRIFNEVSGHDERVAEFGSILPRVLQDPLASTLFALACAAAAAAVLRRDALGRWGAVSVFRLDAAVTERDPVIHSLSHSLSVMNL